MAFSDKLLAQGERVELELRTHVKKIVLPVLALVLIVALTLGAIWLVRSQDWPGWLTWVVLGIALLATIAWVVVPIMKWRHTIYVITNRRLITREGIVTRSGRDIPLYRINDVTYEKGLLDRILGCGTLIVSDATDKAGVRLHDIPDVEQVHVRMNELLFQVDDGTDDGEYPPGEPRRPRGSRY
ncbi:PH (Pleckstrin Homology) domain-containing protein [Barrientosiimonas humi]|uniref:PH (Pleckstrin Homology) domain-containing protein n=2 Tax=Barrientosiimonas TaxID=1535207 RepID=A0A542XB69_9MICO|nr:MULTISPECIES: PH domain-containing protein [Barrientosiimonas]TQL33077.1 PH (Pleckstrin Homology) domain-containing protein [Barrientosiimonas humi]BDZ57947.1 membrane protein [Barrientosiimonas endolithica]CAG7573067.1 hypothetical protein BH39T_PBIAJDOK_01692 [Barrientosiimonas humi]